MFTDKDLERAKRVFGRRLAVAIVIMAALVACIVVTVVLRLRIFGFASSVVLTWALYYYWAMKLNPWRRYKKLLTDMQNGLSRTRTAKFLEAASAPRMADGVAVYDFLVYEGDDEAAQRLYLWDADKPVEKYARGQELTIESFGNYIKNISPA